MSDEDIRSDAASQNAEQQLSDEEIRQQLTAELDELTQRIQALEPEYEPPPFSPKRLTALIEKALARFPKDVQLGVLEQLRGALGENLFDPEVWKGAWYMLNYTVQYNADMVKRRFTGEYDTDEWGLDWEFVDAMRPFLTFLYKFYWRVETTGIENIPIEGRALLASNHSGQLPWDGMMIGTAILTEHPAQRLVRTLYAALLPKIPYASTWLVRMGQTLATEENGIRLLEQEELVAVFPEGYKGTGKTFRDRYKLARFGRGGFVKMALSTGAPIIPVSVVGAEETSITFAKISTLSGTTGIPYIPISLTFPWLGLLGFAPLPTKWYIDFGDPIAVEDYGPEAANNLVLVSQLTDHVRNTVQDMLQDRLAQRRSIFLG
ncbi:MAG TPA: lysophospholipid acyltransferase family protein [Anaerolineae bacterium]|nr:lysophospholipid acyltransferase family protein [Anaerolineae bacterium]